MNKKTRILIFSYSLIGFIIGFGAYQIQSSDSVSLSMVLIPVGLLISVSIFTVGWHRTKEEHE